MYIGNMKLDTSNILSRITDCQCDVSCQLTMMGNGSGNTGKDQLKGKTTWTEQLQPEEDPFPLGSGYLQT